MAHDTLGVMAPFTVAAHALPVISTFQPWFPESLRFGRFVAMTIPARWKFAGRAVMVANSTTLAHVNHLSMMLVIESDRPIKLFQFIQHRHIRPLRSSMSLCCFRLGPDANFQTGVACRGRRAYMTVAARRFSSVLLRLSLIHI